MEQYFEETKRLSQGNLSDLEKATENSAKMFLCALMQSMHRGLPYDSTQVVVEEKQKLISLGAVALHTGDIRKLNEFTSGYTSLYRLARGRMGTASEFSMC